MGFFSGIAGALGSIGSAISRGVSSLCSGLGGFLSPLSGGITAIANSIIGPVIEVPRLPLILGGIFELISALAELLGLKEEEEKPEELAMKAKDAEKKPDDFDSISEYIEYLRKDIQLDKTKVEELSDEERITYATLGTSLYIKEIEEKYGVKSSGEFWHTVNNLKMDGEQVKVYMDSFKEHGISDMDDMAKFLNNQEASCECRPKEISSAIKDSLKTIYPDMSEDAIMDKYMELCESTNVED